LDLIKTYAFNKQIENNCARLVSIVLDGVLGGRTVLLKNTVSDVLSVVSRDKAAVAIVVHVKSLNLIIGVQAVDQFVQYKIEVSGIGCVALWPIVAVVIYRLVQACEHVIAVCRKIAIADRIWFIRIHAAIGPTALTGL
jgi:hypothetical protein